MPHRRSGSAGLGRDRSRRGNPAENARAGRAVQRISRLLSNRLGQNPIVNIKAITMRNDAIFKNVQNGTEVEGCVYHKVPMSAQILRRARNVGGFADVSNVLVMPGIFGVVVQMKPRYYGEAKNVLMSVLSSEYQHPKIAIAVDVDVDIFNYAEVLWSINTRVNPAEDIVTIPGAKIHAMDPSCPEFGHPGAPGWHRIGGKMIIDATKPPECDGSAAQ